MTNKITIGLLLLILCFLGYLTYRLTGLEQKVVHLEKIQERESVNIVPDSSARNKATNPQDASPFDQPDEDPLANQFPPKTVAPPTNIHFEQTKHNFGRIQEGDQVNTTFHFTNAGKNPLILSSVAGSCGCTVPRWPKSPIAPGESAQIDVSYNSSGKIGEQTQTVTVKANTKPAVTELVFTATVVPNDK